ncbi:hypothetical protein BYT27DRAFT_7334072 [Phlegmacium glaucopus]|nr:hypothetical protein BYT27DRAFT_7334072 [Phlegmacium glaucopus]
MRTIALWGNCAMALLLAPTRRLIDEFSNDARVEHNGLLAWHPQGLKRLLLKVPFDASPIRHAMKLEKQYTRRVGDVFLQLLCHMTNDQIFAAGTVRFWKAFWGVNGSSTGGTDAAVAVTGVPKLQRLDEEIARIPSKCSLRLTLTAIFLALRWLLRPRSTSSIWPLCLQQTSSFQMGGCKRRSRN